MLGAGDDYVGGERMILAIDPGPEQSAYVWWDGREIIHHIIYPNESFDEPICMVDNRGTLVIEQIKSYGMAVSDSIFDTVFWSGRICQYWEDTVGAFERMPRMDVKMHLCHDSRAKDSNIRQALIDRFEPHLVGKQRPKGILKGIAKDEWAALALAVTWWDLNTKEGE